eukprot:gene2809-biopygen1365
MGVACKRVGGEAMPWWLVVGAVEGSGLRHHLSLVRFSPAHKENDDGCSRACRLLREAGRSQIKGALTSKGQYLSSEGPSLAGSHVREIEHLESSETKSVLFVHVKICIQEIEEDCLDWGRVI